MDFYCSPKEVYVAVVTGNCGDGKSHFINEQVSEPVEHSQSQSHVTIKSVMFKSKHYNNLYFMDTVGLDIDSIPGDTLRGKEVCYVHITGSKRPKDVEKKLNKMTTPFPCLFYCTYDYPVSPPPYSLITNFKIDDLKFKHYDQRIIPPLPLPKPQPMQNIVVKKEKKIKVKGQVSKTVFGKSMEQLDHMEARVLPLFRSCLQICKQHSDIPYLLLLSITSREQLQEMRHPGETILKYILQRMGLDQSKVDHLITNERFSNMLTDWGLDKHFNSLYQDGNILGDETRADYIEALFEYVYTNEKRHVIPLLKKIIDE